MLIIVDQKISSGAKKTLSSCGELMELQTEGITYPAISGHPDIFFCHGPGKLIVAPNLPERYFGQLNEHKIDFLKGKLPVGPVYPFSARYNAVVTGKYLIHNFRLTDNGITHTFGDLEAIPVEQGYCRCNMLALKDDCFITSDAGIEKVLTRWSPTGRGPEGWRPLGLHPAGIRLPDFPHGFFGGCCGVLDDKVFINGNLQLYPEGEKVRKFLQNLGYEIVELSEEPLTDTGSILFIR